MKKLALIMAGLLLLASCKSEEARWTPTPVAPEPTPSPVPAEERSEDEPWWSGVEADKLPTDLAAPGYEDGEVHYHLCGAIQAEDIYLYRIEHDRFPSVQFLLRRGDVLGGAVTWDGPISDGLCSLSTGDYDGDGEAEYAVSLVHGSGNDLTLCEWDADVGWTFHRYPPADYSAELADALGFHYAGGTATLTYGRDTVSYTLGPEESGPAVPMEDFSGVAFFTPGGDSITASFGVGAVIGGVSKPFGLVLAAVEYDGEAFTLRDMRLLSTTGV